MEKKNVMKRAQVSSNILNYSGDVKKYQIYQT